MLKIKLYNVMVGKYVIKRTGEAEFDVVGNKLCTMSKDNENMIDIRTNQEYQLLKRNESGQLIRNQNLEENKDYAISILREKKFSKIKVLQAKRKNSLEIYQKMQSKIK